ncbi:hypothetical protein WN944_015123 [Citrus x changshan-huyou]|uniref:Uncharacterized protein n=1 Tax=Citrus x changshan-huyou TaxID=2935761 RepID=A0AAP0M719_9ROSI
MEGENTKPKILILGGTGYLVRDLTSVVMTDRDLTGVVKFRQRARPAWPAARAARAASCACEFGAFPATWRRVIRRRRCVGGRLASEQWRRFLETAVGEEGKEKYGF